MFASLSKVYKDKEGYRFFASVEEKTKGYQFILKCDASKARARLLKRLKIDGFKIICI